MFQDILDFIEDSTNGVILFTFGSTIAVNSLPRNIITAFKEAIAQLPQRVLLKYEGEMKDKPKNVMTKKWLPQRDILCKIILKDVKIILKFVDKYLNVYFINVILMIYSAQKR